MVNNKGFTLIELLAVIVLLGVIITIAVPSINGIVNSINKNMLEKKVVLIEEAASMMGEDIKGSIINSSLKYKDFPCKSFIISDLVPQYLDKDNDNECLAKDSTETLGCIINPSAKDTYLDKLEVIIYYKNKRISAKVDTLDELTCS